MVKAIPKKVRAKVLWDAGHKTPKLMLRRGNIPIRSAQRYIADFKIDGSQQKKEYKKRAKLNNRGEFLEK